MTRTSSDIPPNHDDSSSFPEEHERTVPSGPPAEPANLRIGKVCAQLRVDFPDVTISKLRFLEDQGLVQPRRTRGGYRMYSSRDVQKLRAILAMQRDEFLPLRIIRNELEQRMRAGRGASAVGAVGAGSEPAARGSNDASISRVPSRAMYGAGASERNPIADIGVLLARTSVDDGGGLDAAAVCAAADVSRDVLDACVQYDIVSARQTSQGLRFAEGDVRMVSLVGRLARYGIEVRNLRQVRASASRQAGLVEQFAAPRMRAWHRSRRSGEAHGVEDVARLIGEFVEQAFVNDVAAMVARFDAGART